MKLTSKMKLFTTIYVKNILNSRLFGKEVLFECVVGTTVLIYFVKVCM